MPQGRGGAGRGQGRKPKATKYESSIIKAEKRAADKLPDIIDNLFRLADGLQEVVQEEWQPVGIVMKGTGPDAVLAFPDLAKADPTTPILVKRTVTKPGMDRAANVYLADRVMGKPTQRNEISGANGDALRIEIVHADPDS